MPHTISEIKARTNRLDALRAVLQQNGAYHKGNDHQVDTYFNVPQGRLKLRQGNIENALIFYNRPEVATGPKHSHVTMTAVPPDTQLGEVLAAALGVKVQVDKRREIYFIGNVKFHLDEVAGLGHFVEIEAIDLEGTIGQAELQRQCTHYMHLLGIEQADLIAASYSDLLLQQ
jgi:predicted adenylyl cyclase CyaB